MKKTAGVAINSTKNTKGTNTGILSKKQVLQGLQILKGNLSEYGLIVAEVCNNAIILNHQAGISLIGNNATVLAKQWSKSGLQDILNLKEFMDLTLDLANGVKIAPDGIVTCKKKDMLNYIEIFVDSECKAIDDSFLQSVFDVTILNDIKEGNFNISGRLKQTNLLYAISLILAGIKEMIHDNKMKNAAAFIGQLKTKFPELQLPVQLQGSCEIATSEGKGIFEIDFAHSKIDCIECELMSGENIPEHMHFGLGIEDILSIEGISN